MNGQNVEQPYNPCLGAALLLQTKSQFRLLDFDPPRRTAEVASLHPNAPMQEMGAVKEVPPAAQEELYLPRP